MRMLASEVAAAGGGTLAGPDVTVDGAAVDSREVRGGELFVPVVGQRDGHDFIAGALAAGAAAYLTARPPVGGTAVVVDHPTTVLTALGAAARHRLPDRVVGVTGSVGKTSVKDMAAACLGQRYRTAASPRSFNNELGVPLTLFGAPDGTEALVVEMGSRGRGHVAALCAVAAPVVGVVTRVALVHGETFGTVAEVARSKAELVEALPASGTAVLNADDERVAAMANRTEAGVLTYGEGAGEVRADGVALDGDLRPSFRLRSPMGSARVTLTARGRHQVSNALAAAAAALALEVSVEEVATGLARATLSPWRMELGRAPSGAVVLNDAYNANPASTTAALRSLAALDAERRTAVLGVMAELGAGAVEEHRAVAALASELGIRVLAVAAPLYGGENVDDLDQALAALGRLGPGDAVLVKGSRIAGLERLAARLLADS